MNFFLFEVIPEDGLLLAREFPSAKELTSYYLEQVKHYDDSFILVARYTPAIVVKGITLFSTKTRLTFNKEVESFLDNFNFDQDANVDCSSLPEHLDEEFELGI